MQIFKRNYLIAAVLFASSFIISYSARAVEDRVVLPKTGHRKPPIVFTHKNHSSFYGIKCIVCHHKGKNAACSTCHLRRDQGKVINLKGAFHQQCHDCHRRSAGPRGCSRCHVRTGKR